MGGQIPKMGDKFSVSRIRYGDHRNEWPLELFELEEDAYPPSA
jgi:hypothetical protein